MAQPTIPMSSTVSSWLITLGQVTSALGAMLLVADPESVPFGLDAYQIGVTCVFISNLATAIVVGLRKNIIPGVTSGSGITP